MEQKKQRNQNFLQPPVYKTLQSVYSNKNLEKLIDPNLHIDISFRFILRCLKGLQ